MIYKEEDIQDITFAFIKYEFLEESKAKFGKELSEKDLEDIHMIIVEDLFEERIRIIHHALEILIRGCNCLGCQNLRQLDDQTGTYGGK